MKIIVAVDLNWGIGYKGNLLERIPEDMKFFKQMTLGKVVVMGRKTFESLPGKEPLKDRLNIVLTNNGLFFKKGITICRSLNELFHELEKYSTDEVFVIGGEKVYSQLLPYCKEAYVTKIENSYKADKYFVNLNEDERWKLAFSGDLKKYNSIQFQFLNYVNSSVSCFFNKAEVKHTKKENLIDRVAEAFKNDCGAIFVGSGISYESTEVDWFKLLEPLTKEIDINIDNEHDDLPLIAQYIVNHYSGNRGPLINQISKAFNKKFQINDYHKALAATKISAIWTTNYDTLLETAFSDFLIDVKVNDDSISRNVNNSEIEIIKMHGCISRSHHDEITITQEDYEDFLVNKPAISQRLCNDLLHKSFLFIGYSYRDPNIRNIMVLARRLSKKSTQEHFLILKRATDKDPLKCKEKAKRQELWCNDLKRLGISTLLIDNYDELKSILCSISHRSRGRTVYITGSHEDGKQKVTKKLGVILAKEKDIILMNGQSSGVGANVVSEFTKYCIENQIDVNCRMHIFPNPYAANPNFSNDFSLLQYLKRYRAKLLNSTQVVIIFSGQKGTEAELEVAINRNCKIIPAVVTPDDRNNDVIKKVLKNKSIMDYIQKADNEYHNKLTTGIVSAEDIYKCLMKILK